MSLVDNSTPGCDVKSATNSSDNCLFDKRLPPFFSLAMDVEMFKLLWFRSVQINKIKMRNMRFFTIILQLQ